MAKYKNHDHDAKITHSASLSTGSVCASFLAIQRGVAPAVAPVRSLTINVHCTIVHLHNIQRRPILSIT